MRTKGIWIFLVLVISFILGGCDQANPEQPEPTQKPTQIPTDTSVPPTDTLEPTATEIPASDTPEPTDTTVPPTFTPLPEGVLFRDDFEGSIQPGWEWENENPDKWMINEDGWLVIEGEQESLLGDEIQNNLLWYSLPEGDFVITVHLGANPSENFHQATIYIYEDPENYIALNRGYCDICDTGGNGFYMEYKIGGVFGGYSKATDAEDVYLKLESKDDILSGFYATEMDQWERLGRFGNYFQFQKVGIGVSNVGAESNVTGRFDFFEISVP